MQFEIGAALTCHAEEEGEESMSTFDIKVSIGWMPWGRFIEIDAVVGTGSKHTLLSLEILSTLGNRSHSF